MKKFKKLIPAFCMLLVSAVMLGSSTFAWFSMNNKVTATGMEVTAKSNTQFLVISDSATLPADNAMSVDAKYTAGGEGTNHAVLPITINKGETTTIYDKNAGAVSVAKDAWYTARSTVYNNAGANGTSQDNTTLVDVAVITGDGNLNAYRLTYKVYLSLAANSDPMTGAVKMTATFDTTTDKSVSLRVVVNSKNYDFSNADSGTKVNTTESMTITTGNFVEVTIYAYIDGTSSTVNSAATLSTLKGNASLAFEVVGA